MAQRTLDPDRMSLEDLLEEVDYTLIRARLSPDAAFLMPRFETLYHDAETAAQTERALLRRLFAAGVAIGWRDEGIDDGVRSLALTLRKLVNGDLSDPLYRRYFGVQAPSEITRPILGPELVTVRGWVESLESSTHAELKQEGQVLTAQIQLADAAVNEETTAQQRYNDFRLTGDRIQIFERVNAERKVAYGELAKLPHLDTGKHLPADFADRFFRAVPRRARDVGSVETARNQLARAQRQLDDAQERLKEAEVLAQAAASEKIARAAEAQELRGAEKAAREAQRRVTELRHKRRR